MDEMVKKIKVILLSFLTFSIFTNGCNGMKISSEKIHKQIEVAPNTFLTVENINGSIFVEVSENKKVVIRIEKKSYFGYRELKKVDIKFSKSENNLDIKTNILDSEANVSIDYFIQVPSNIFVSNLVSRNGNITIKKTKGDIVAKTTNGSIFFEKVDGWISGFTQNGTVKAFNVTGVKEIQTTNGAVDCEILNLPQDGTRITTNNANINIIILSNKGMFLDLATSNGSIITKNLDEIVITKTNTFYKSKIKEGGKTIFVKTENGNIHITKQN